MHIPQPKIITAPTRTSTSQTFVTSQQAVQEQTATAQQQNITNRINNLLANFDEAAGLLSAYSSYVQSQASGFFIPVTDPEVQAALRTINPQSDGKSMTLQDFLRAVDIIRLVQPTPEVLATTTDITPRKGFDSSGNPILYFANGTTVSADGTVNNMYKPSSLSSTTTAGTPGTSGTAGTGGTSGAGTSSTTIQSIQPSSSILQNGTILPGGSVNPYGTSDNFGQSPTVLLPGTSGTSQVVSTAGSSAGTTPLTLSAPGSASQSSSSLAGTGNTGTGISDTQYLPAIDELQSNVDPNFLDTVYKRKRCPAQTNYLLQLLLNVMMSDDTSLDVLIILKAFIGPLEDLFNGALGWIGVKATWMEDLAYSVYMAKKALSCLTPFPQKCYCTSSGGAIYQAKAQDGAQYTTQIQNQIAALQQQIQSVQNQLASLPVVASTDPNAAVIQVQSTQLSQQLTTLQNQLSAAQSNLDNSDAQKAQIISTILCVDSSQIPSVQAFKNADIYNYISTKYPNDTGMIVRLLEALVSNNISFPDYTQYMTSAQFTTLLDIVQPQFALSDEFMIFIDASTLTAIKSGMLTAMTQTNAPAIAAIDTGMNSVSTILDIPYASGAALLSDQFNNVQTFMNAVNQIQAMGSNVFEKRLIELGVMA